MAEILIFGQEESLDESLKKGRDWAEKKEVLITGDPDEAKRRVSLEDYIFIVIDLEEQVRTGLQLASFIRSLPRHFMTPLLFLATDRQYEELAFHELHCYDYYVKPLTPEELMKLSSLCLKRMVDSEKNDPIVFPVGRDIYKINPEDILYLESRNRVAVVHTIEEELIVPSLRLSDFIERYGEFFLRIHRGIVVNRNKVCYFDSGNSQVELSGSGDRLGVGRTYADSVRRELKPSITGQIARSKQE